MKFGAGLPGAGSRQSADVLESSQRANALIDAALAAHGGPAVLEAVRNMRIVLDGTQHFRHQSRRVDPPYDQDADRSELWLDLPNGQIVSARWMTFPGGARRHTGFITDGRQGFSVNFRQQTHTTSSTYPPASEQTGHLYNLPQFILRDLVAARARRSLGRMRLTTGVEVDVVVAAAGGQLLTVGFDVSTGLVRATMGVSNDLLVGAQASETEFVDYRERSGLLMPSRRIVRSGGVVLTDHAYDVIEPGARIPTDRLTPPAGSRDLTAHAQAASVRTLAEGVWAIGGGAAVVAVALRDHVLVVDAPPNADAILEQLAKVAPGKPVRVVVPTHHHDDHSGGVGRFARAGVTILTTRGNRRFMGALAGPAHIGQVTVMDSTVHVFEDGNRRVEIHRIDGGPHADEMLVAWIPSIGLLYQADLIDVGSSGDIPPGTNNETTVHFADWLRAKAWQVQTYAGSHGSLQSAGAFDALVTAPILPLIAR